MLMEQWENQNGTSLKTLSINQRVLVQNPITKSWDDQGIITKVRPLGRSYEVLMDSGKMFLRNRTLLRPITINNILMDSTAPSTANPSQQQSLPVRRSERLFRQNNQRRCQAILSPGGEL